MKDFEVEVQAAADEKKEVLLVIYLAWMQLLIDF